MNILFVVPYVPSIIYVRPYNLIRNIVQRGHRVHLLTLIGNEVDRQAAAQLEEVCSVSPFPLPRWRSLLNATLALPSKTPLQASYCWQKGAANWLVDRIKEGEDDLIHIEHLRGVRYGLHAQKTMKSLGKSLPIVWDSVDSISYLFRQASSLATNRTSRLITRLETGRTATYEGEMVSKFQQVLVTSPIDQQALLENAPHSSSANINVLPNGCDLDYFKPDNTLPREQDTLVVSGKMSYHANIAMTLYLANEILPRLRKYKPDVKLWIVGKDPSTEIVNLQKNKNILVTGSVEDLRPYLQRATISVSPLLYGAGIQNKVLEAMACGTPVVTTPLAIRSLNVENGKELCVADNPESFAQVILELLDDPIRRDQIGKAGRQYVEQHHDWSKIAAQLEAIYMKNIQ